MGLQRLYRAIFFSFGSSVSNNFADASVTHVDNADWDRLLRYSPSVLFVCAANEPFTPTHISSNLIDVLGLSRADVIADSSSWTERIQPEHRASRLSGLRQAAAGAKHTGEYLFCRPNGTDIWLRETLSPEPDADGIVRRIVGSLTDISDSRRRQVGLAESDSRYRLAFETAGLPAAMIGEEGRLIDVNQAMAAWLGYSIDEMRGMSFFEIFHPGEVAENQYLRDKMWHGGVECFHLEKRYLRKDGSVLWGLLNNAIVRNAERQPLYSIAFIQDITEQRKADDIARKAHERLVDAIAAMPDGFALFDADERLVLCNDGYRRLPAVESACLPGTHIEDILAAAASNRSDSAGGPVR